MDDFVADFDTKDEAIEAIQLKNATEDSGSFEWNWAHVYDTEDRINVWSTELNQTP